MKHPEWYKHDAQGNIIPPATGLVGCGRVWTTRNPAVARCTCSDMLKYWLTGIRPGRIPVRRGRGRADGFLGVMRAQELAQIKPDIIMIAEANKPELVR